MRGIWVLLGVLSVAGCKLVDQTTFAPSPEATTAVKQAPKVDPRTPLLTIGFSEPNPNYQDVLRYAVQTAETRAPGVQYDVVAMLPSGDDLTVEQHRAADVMRAIMAQGVSPDRIHLGLRTEPAGTLQQVRVYVR